MKRRFNPINLYRYSLATISVTVLVILWGAYVRATGAGAGCGSHWPLCNGVFVPRSPTLETVIEFIHRVTSGIAFLQVMGLALLVKQRYTSGHTMRLLASMAVLLMVLEALIGAGLVLFELVAFNPSIARAIVGALHLLNTFLLLGTLTLLAEGSRQATRGRFIANGVRYRVLLVGILGILLVGMSGAIAALGDTLFPSVSLLTSFAQDIAPDAHFLIRLRIWHPFIAVSATLLLLIGMRLPSPGLRQDSILQLVITVLLITQLFAGVINVLLLAPVWLQIVHLLLADLIWIGSIMFLHQTQRVED